MLSKKPVSLMAVLCMCAVLLCGCQQSKNHGLDPKKPTTITIWHYYNGVQQENFDSMLLEFNETVGRDQGIIVEGRSKGSVNDLADATLASLRKEPGAEAAPDMFAAYSETAFVADQLGSVVDLSQYFTEEELSAYVDGYLDEGNLKNDGTLKIFPIGKSTEIMMINLTDWQAFAGATGASLDSLSTWEGLAATAASYYDYTDALTPDVENDGKAFFGRDSIANYMVVGAKQLGLEYVSVENGAATLNENKDAVRRLWDNYYAPYVSGYYCANARFRSDDAKVGDIIAAVCSTTGAAYFPSSVTINDELTYPIEELTIPVPNFEGTDPYVVQQGAGMVVVKSEEAKEYACTVFLKWFTEEERNISFGANSGYLPVKKAANDFDKIAASYESNGGSRNDPLCDAIKGAVEEINGGYSLYAAKSFEKSAEVRSFLDSYIQTTAQAARDEAAERIEAGESRADVLAEYLSDDAFDAWYAGFASGVKAASAL